jgi:ribonuclease BN (tRNA processing enzyme)
VAQLEIVGSRGGCPQPDNPCAGYLFTAAPTCVLIDCGPGVAGWVWPLLRRGALSAIVVSHMHGDHFMDLIPLTYGLLGEDALLTQPASRTAVWLPPGGRSVLGNIARAFGFAEIHMRGEPCGGYAIPLVERYFDVREYDPADSFDVEQLRITPRYVPHTIEACALRVDDAGHSLVYSGDTSGGPDLEKLASGCDLLLCEASAVRRDASLPPGHLSAGEAGNTAARAEVGRLVLTHTIEYDATADALIGEAARAFKGPIEVASPRQSFALTAPEARA